ncbi:hypothetical protein QLX08_002177 [Tetragonisca angustula]|uniref:Sensory neuron membrane protein 1 n=1 Tax=Tetragonisca angustula TaxID=166442 RepID=A0AAW1ACD8_9HYME
MKPKKLGIIGGFFLVFGFCVIGFPSFFRSQLKKRVTLKPNSTIRKFWSHFPFPLDFKVYLFNVTNPAEISAGKKPIVQEVGPFFYDEYRHKINLVDREEDDSVEYSTRTTWFFNPSLSSPLTGEEEIVIPHLFIVSMVKLIIKYQPKAVGVLNKTVDTMFHKPSSIFVRVKAREILFDGLPIDCTGKDFGSKVICSVLKQRNDVFIPTGPEQYLFSIFGFRNGTIAPDRIRVLRGTKDYKDVGKVIELNGQKKLNVWPEDECNTFHGTDATIFAPILTENEDLVTFLSESCRSFSLHFSHKNKVKGINTFHYTADLGDMSTNPAEKCFCPTRKTCLTKNLFDVSKCIDIPIIVSLPHFLGSDEKYLKMVDGLHPNDEDHAIHMDFEPTTCLPLALHSRTQFNMFLQKVTKFQLMKNFPKCLFPFLWLEQGLTIPDKFMVIIIIVFKLISIIRFMKWFIIISGTCMSGTAARMFFKGKEKRSLNVTEAIPQSENEKDETDEQIKWANPTNKISTIPPIFDTN